MASTYAEAARERDLQRYFQPWLDVQNIVDSADGRSKGLTYEGYQPESSKDKALTAFAQLAALRLNVRRAMVSLVDSNRQYILAEATKTVSLFGPYADRPEDEVWLGNTIIARQDAICPHTFLSTYVAKEKNGEEYEAECMVIPDCRQDPRFLDKDYVKGEPGVRFYAGVPIVTKAGFQIGVYAVSDEKPRDGLSAAEVRFMQQVAAAVMEHLELAKDRDDRNKGELMVRGLADFIERSSLQEMRIGSNSRLSIMQKQTENAKLEALEEEVPPGEMVAAVTADSQRTCGTITDTSKIFQRAARIIRQSTDADGVVFFDTSAAAMTGHMYQNSSPLASSDESSKHTTTDFDTADSASTVKRKRRRDRVLKPTTEDVPTDPTTVPDTKICPVLGFSHRRSETALTESDFVFRETSMKRYIMRYPKGKFFNFNEEGLGINSSDERSERSETEHSDYLSLPGGPASQKPPRKRKERFIPTELLRILPSVRSLIFLPLWDPASERWVAGAFIWINAVGRLVSPDTELPYLKAFGNCITSEVARLNAQKSDRAKTTFIASISHELRSPLHGILGSAEFLHDTITSPYQGSLVQSIETCGRTLLDTIDHVLDYAKINKLRNAGRKKQRAEGRSEKVSGDNSILGVTSDYDLAQLVEEVCDTVCAGHTFRRTHTVEGGFYDHSHTSNEEAGNSEAQQDSQNRVTTTLNIAPFVSWIVRSQPGALRRVVMNLLGNSLKYTESGFIAVSLLQDNSSAHSIGFTLTIEDSGKGMSDEYQRTKLFSPFSQEDPFTSGTGLGLSIVKQIVESFKGDIEVTSTINVGTKIKVSLRLPAGKEEKAKMNPQMFHAPEKLKKKTVGIVFPSETLSAGDDRLKDSIRRACLGLHMNVFDTFDLRSSQPPEFLITESSTLEAFFHQQADRPSNGRPLAVICVTADPYEKEAVETRISRQIAALGWVVEVVAQLCGPRKLARVLLETSSRASKEAAERISHRSQSSHRLVPPSPPALAHRSVSDNNMEKQESYISAEPAVITLSGASPPVPLGSPSSLQPGEYFSPRVLLVDDNAINLKLLTVFAKRQKLQYAEAMDGLSALERYKAEANRTFPPSKSFDVVLMDVSMPIMDGLEATRQIRQFEMDVGLERSTIVALTGLASAQDQQNAVDAGVDMYLVKPVKFANIKTLFEAK